MLKKGWSLPQGVLQQKAKREANPNGVIPIEIIDGSSPVDLFEKYRRGLNPVVKVFEIDQEFLNGSS